MIIFSVSALDKAPVTLKGSEPETFADLSAEDPLQVTSPVSYSLTASKVSGGVLVSGEASVSIHGTCGRCLKDVDAVVRAEDIELFFEVEPSQEELDVSEDVRAELLLEFPMNLLCSDDCAGLCPECGADLNSSECKCRKNAPSGDFRWSALDKLDL